ncbi:bacterial type II and III secretion system family protein [Asticcacaulis biprosthecium C19]|uniref:Bacterial type II and III secretion system family protein n=1 Tax=Asticcacaulis biprosthecium C19 TaxID=715226 RepID=F4QJ54_9CAUL|nr:type II and III secretion system protein family protein [Asticcacaulis biprosthecium]EGF91885.1 bacterial type II and III secretion system family protein [Asticcacaulis biprosthecium C19]
MSSFLTPSRALLPATALAGLMTLLATGAHATGEPKPYNSLKSGGGGGMAVQTQTSQARVQVLRLPKGRSAVVDLPTDAADVFVSNPAVADAVLRTPRRIFVLGVEGGQSDAIFFDAQGRQILNLSIRVEAATDELTDTVHRLFPTSKVEVQSLNGRVVLSGLAQNNAQADQIARLAASYVTKPEDVINLMSIAGKDQVTLKVRVIEVQRSAIKQLGLSSDIVYNNGSQSYSYGRGNTYGTNGTSYGGRGLCYGQNNVVTNNFTDSNSVTDQTAVTLEDTPVVNRTLTATIGSAVNTTWRTLTGSSNATCLQAFERVGLIRTLAEPNLTAVSGEAAKFLAGGEFPVPVAEDDAGRITVEFKPFGVGLGFTPVVLSEGRISMKISTEVSEITNVGAFTSNGSNLTIPGLSVRRAETTVEMQSGGSLMIAGLLQSKYKQSIDSLPGMTSLPILGSLFRSRDFLNEDTELVVMVTPYIVDPVHPDQLQTPADNLEFADDMSTVFMGRLNKVVDGDAVAAGVPASGPTGPYVAPIGYVIE